MYRIYVNGIELGASPPGKNMWRGRPSLYLGSFGGVVYGFSGVMDEVKLYNSVRTAAQIAADADADENPEEPSVFRSWVVPDPLYDELLTNEPPGLRAEGSLMWQHLLDVPIDRESVV